ncbi:hypothetical protein TsFJ059_004619 [Trichoderma semiorbis]|uniref:Uncharacterized protein n=1 Tax=Trichoderma semiorbis TaxID=1491008 RepID=A0A9P8KX80_9HYPO|nr:hypothetical protein TsFJ059_004619 [Trichoderma semiorbis]
MDQHDTSLSSANSLNYSGVVAHHTVQLVRPSTAATNSRTPVGRRKICPKDDAQFERQVTSWPEGEKVAFLQAAETTLPLNWFSPDPE